MSENFGNGIGLDRYFDFDVGSTGDLVMTYGEEELEKDLAFQQAIALQDFVGIAPTPQNRAQALQTASRVAAQDVRIDTVLREESSVEWVKRRRELVVELKVIAEDKEYDLVFEI